MHFIGLHFGAQGGVHTLVSRNGAFAFKFCRHHGGVPMAAVTFEFQVLAHQAGGNKGFDLIGCHVNG
jgi:hypothetical protein